MRMRVRAPAPSSSAKTRLERLAGDVISEPGRPLPSRLRSELEARFKHDLGRIRIHTGPRADALAGDLAARAAALGDDLVFGAGEFRPDTLEGRRLLAHEIAHAVQAAHAAPVLDAEPPAVAEPEARAAAAAVTSGHELAPGALTPIGLPGVQRFLASLPLRESAAPLADAFVETLALDMARVLDADPADTARRTRRRVDRLAEPVRAAVIGRLLELLPESRRQVAADALTEATVGQRERPEPPAPVEPEAAVEAEPAEAEGAETAEPAPELEPPAAEPAPIEAVEEEAAAAAEPLAAEAEPEEPAAPEAVSAVEPTAPEAAVPAGGPPAGAPPSSPAAGEMPANPDLAPIAELEAEVERRGQAEEALAAAATPEAPAPATVPSAPPELEPVEPAPAEPLEPAAEEPAAPEPPEPAAEETAAPEPPEPAEAPAAVEPADESVPAGVEPSPAETPAVEPPAVEVPAIEAAAPGGEPAATEAPDEPGAVEAAPQPAEGEPAEAMAAGAEATGECGPDIGGGGGGAAAVSAEAPAAAAPDVSQAEPSAAMGAIAVLPPVEMGQALTQVDAATAQDTGARREQLAAQPPSMERPAGSPQTRPAGAAARAAEASSAVPAVDPVQRVSPESTGGTAGPEPLPPAPPLPTRAVAAPAVGAAPQQTLSAADAQAMAASVDALPTTDPALYVEAGPAPTVTLAGDADPQLAADQHAAVEQRTAEAHAEARADAARPLGEADIYPDVAPGTITAEIAAAEAPSPRAPFTAPDEATTIVAREQHADAVRAAAAQSQSQMAADRERHDQQVTEGQARSRDEVAEIVRTSAEKQAAQREKARRDIGGRRGEWAEAQDSAVGASRTRADGESRRATTEVETERATADRRAAERVDQGNRDAATARTNAERDARAERERGREESRGVLGWFADRARGFFDALKRGLERILDAARTLVRTAIETAQRAAGELIDAARRRIVSAIQAVADRLLAIADDLLAAFPDLRERFRAAIQTLVDAAVTAVNRLAAVLEAGVRLALNALGTVLDGYLRLLHTVYGAAIDFVAGAVNRAIESARAVVQAFAAFAELIADVAADPLGWLRNLGAAAVDGLRNHVWRVLKCHVKAWFNSKVEEVLGVGRMIYQLLRSGGIRLLEIGRMVWDALKAALPGIVIQMAIEKLIALLVPAASALMLIIDGLRAAWGAMSRIIAAFEAFFRFLKAVKTGNAGRQFAEALAAGAIALIDFLSNFLVVRLKGAASGVGGRLSAMASRIGARLGRVAQVARRGARAVRTVGARVVRAARAAGRGVAGVVRRAARAVRRLPGVRRARARLRLWQRRRRQRAAERRRRRQQRAQERLQRAVTAIRPQAQAMLRGGVGRIRWRLQLLRWQIQYRLRSLRVRGRTLVARVNPPGDIVEVDPVGIGTTLEQILQRAEAEYLRRVLEGTERGAQVERAVEDVRAGRAPDEPLPQLDPVQRVAFFRRLASGAPVDPESISMAGVTRAGRPRRFTRLRWFAGEQAAFVVGWASGPLVGTPGRAGALRSYYSAYVRRRRKGATGSYAQIARDAERFEAILGPGTGGRIVAAASAPGRAAQQQILDRILDEAPGIGGGPAREAAVRAALERSTQALGMVRTIEAARMPGQLASQALSVSAGGTVQQTFLEDPMQGRSAAIAADIETGRSPRPAPGSREEAEYEAATARRRARITAMFDRLRQRVANRELLAESREQRSALAAVARAFNALVRARTADARPADVGRLPQIEARLVAAIVSFLQTYHGGRA